MERIVSDVYSEFQSPVKLWLISCAITLLIYKTSRLLLDRRQNPSRLPLPPGPKGYPLIGNVLDIPTSQQWNTYAEWAKVYGELALLRQRNQKK